jgi:D-lactate dehydrogenase
VKVGVFDADAYVREYFDVANARFGHELTYFEGRLNRRTTPLAAGFPCVCGFVNDQLDELTLEALWKLGTRLVALRSAGFNNVDLLAAERLGFKVSRVPSYSPHAVAEHAAGILLCLNRNIHKAFFRVRNLNFSTEGLLGFDLLGKTVGIIGTGRIGIAFAEIMKGFGTEVLAFDTRPNQILVEEGVLNYVELPELYRRSDVISLHAPLTPSTHHLINHESIAMMKRGVFLINTSRGALIDAKALIEGLKSGQIGAAGLDVYEEEEGIFYENLSDGVLQDDVLARLLTFPNVLITSHQGYLTREALSEIAESALTSITEFEQGRELTNELRAQPKAA